MSIRLVESGTILLMENITITNAKTAVVVRFWTKRITRVAVQLATRERYVRFADLNTATNSVTAGER